MMLLPRRCVSALVGFGLLTALCDVAFAQTSALPFSDGLARLVRDVSDGFVADRAAKVGQQNGTAEYAVTFTISGLKPCRVSVSYSFASAACEAYGGSDANLAAAAYASLKAKVNDFVGEQKPHEVSTVTGHESVVNRATYNKDHTILTVEMKRVRDAFQVTLKVAPSVAL
jgi:hypothetical protein